MCPHGCKPDPNLGKNEIPVQTLIREALEFQVRDIVCWFFDAHLWSLKHTSHWYFAKVSLKQACS